MLFFFFWESKYLLNTQLKGVEGEGQLSSGGSSKLQLSQTFLQVITVKKVNFVLCLEQVKPKC